MLSDALYYRKAFSRLHYGDPDKYAMCPTEDEWEVAEQLCTCLKSFHIITELLSGTLYPTSNLFFQEFCEVHLLLHQWSKGVDPFLIAMVQVMKIKFNKYLQKSNLVLAMASFLDPRYKLEMVDYYYPQIYDSFGDEETAVIHRVIKSIYDEYCINHLNPIEQVVHSAFVTSQRAGQHHDVNIGSYNNDRKRKFSEYILQKSQQQSKKTDLDLYIEEATLPWDSDCPFDILAWWRTKGSKCPVLSRVARNVFAISVSIVASKSAFSIGGRVINAYRCRLGPEIVEKLICTQDWIRGSSKGLVPSILHDTEEGFIVNEDASTSQSESCAL